VSKEFNSKVVIQYSLDVHNYMGPIKLPWTSESQTLIWFQEFMKYQ